MKIRIASILFMFLTLLPIYGKSENHGAVKANFDERIELMSIICHLAGFQEYNMNLGGLSLRVVVTFMEKAVKLFFKVTNFQGVLQVITN